jgi:hypothetical protein
MRLLFIFLFFALSSFFPNTVQAGSSKMEIFKDANYSSPSLNFGVGEQIYVKVESDNPGETKRELKLRDNLYKEISTFGFSREGASPFRYKVSFSAPNSLGFYSLEATIESPGSVDKLVQTIQVGEVAKAQIKTDIRTQINTGSKQKITGTPTPQPKKGEVLATPSAELEATPIPTFSPTPTLTPAPVPLIFRFFGGIGNFFVTLLKFLLPF